MPAYRINGTAQICIFSIWTERTVQVEVRGMDREGAISAALELCRRTAERQDPHALVRWMGRPGVIEGHG